jgi:hypothetical protein
MFHKNKNSSLRVLYTIIDFAKGQLFWKCLLGSSILKKKRIKTIDLKLHSSKVEFFRSFFGELKISKRHFEIN